MSGEPQVDVDTTVVELAGIVATALAKAKIVAVLSGGAAAAAYTENRYLTRDIDFVTSAGHLQIFEWGEIRTTHGPVQILTRTQMIMDRLVAWFHRSDPQSLDRAF